MADVDEHQKIASLSGLTGMKNSNEESAADASAALKQQAARGIEEPPTSTEGSPRYQVYCIRWFILFLFVMYSTSNAFQWTQLVIITNILEKYYQVKTLAVSWTSMIFMVTYIPLIFPASWFLQKKSLRHSVFLGSLGTCLGSWIKVFATERAHFPIMFAGQTVVAISQIFILGIPPQLAATWFPSHQVSSACAIGVFGNQLGVALGFVIPVSVVANQKLEENIHLIGEDLYNMFLTVAVLTTVLFIVIVIAFKSQPLTPPSRAQELIRMGQDDPDANVDYLASIKRLMTNRGYVLLLITYGLNVGVFYAISTLLNTVIMSHFENAEADAGRIGLAIVISGMAGSMCCGLILDKTHAFKMTTLVVYLMSFIGMIIYTFTMRCGYIQVVYCTACLLGFFMTGYLPLGFEFAAEITFPESEGTSSGLLNASAQVFGIFCTMAAEQLLTHTKNDLIANGVLAVVLLIGTILTALIKADYRRQAASKTAAIVNGTNTGC